MADVTMNFDFPAIKAFFASVEGQMKALPDEQKRLFEKSWKAREADGSELVDMWAEGKEIKCVVSSSFKRHLEAFGISAST